MLSVTFFGTSSAIPSTKRGFACIGVGSGDDIVLIDCGDGSIRKILDCGLDVRRISNIMITHFHSDHLSGLTQIVEAMGIAKRETELRVYGLKGLKEYFATVERITSVAANRKFKIALTEVAANQQFQVGKFGVSTFEMIHTIPCIGYRLESDGRTIAYTGDTEPCPQVVDLGKNADLLIHEATFLKRDIENARQSKHSVPSEASQSAKLAGSKKLFLTHVTDSAEKEDEMLMESTPVFKETSVAHDGLTITL
ncbi:MAG: ribonuclease Z [Nitrososphaerota archaeon]|nr:ribonuclease Z [Nitrososphaerota archaeon]